MAIFKNKDPMKSKYIVVVDPNDSEPIVWGFDSTKLSKEVYMDYKRSKEDVLLATIMAR